MSSEVITGQAPEITGDNLSPKAKKEVYSSFYRSVFGVNLYGGKGVFTVFTKGGATLRKMPLKRLWDGGYGKNGVNLPQGPKTNATPSGMWREKKRKKPVSPFIFNPTCGLQSHGSRGPAIWGRGPGLTPGLCSNRAQNRGKITEPRR